MITSSAAGYTLNVDPASVDALQVAGTAEQLGAVRSTGDLAALDATCSAALALFRGELLADSGDPWLDPHRA